MCITPEQAYAAIKVLYPAVDYIRRPLNDIYKDIIVQMHGGANRTIHAPLDVAWGGVKRYPPEPVKWRDAQLRDISLARPVSCRVSNPGSQTWHPASLRGIELGGSSAIKPYWLATLDDHLDFSTPGRFLNCQVIDK